MARQKRKRNYTRTIDLLFLFIFLIVGIVAIYIALSFGIPPRKWTMMAAGILFIIFLIFFITSLKTTSQMDCYYKKNNHYNSYNRFSSWRIFIK